VSVFGNVTVTQVTHFHPFGGISLSIPCSHWLPFSKSDFWTQSQEISSLDATFLSPASLLVLQRCRLCSWARNRQIALPNLRNATALAAPSFSTHIEYLRSALRGLNSLWGLLPVGPTVAACKIGICREESTARCKSSACFCVLLSKLSREGEIFGDDSNKSKFNSRGNLEEI
jgi:hypothetical protein